MEMISGLVGGGIAAVVTTLVAWLVVRSGRDSQRARLTAEAEAQARATLAAERARLTQADAARASELDQRQAHYIGLAAVHEGRQKRLDDLERAINAREEALAARSDALDRRAQSIETREARSAEREAAAKSAEERLAQREAHRDAQHQQREQQYQQREAQRDEHVQQRERELAQSEQRVSQRLAEVAGLTPEQARQELLSRLDGELIAEQAARILANEKRVQEKSKEQATEIISRAIQRYAAEHTAATTTARVVLPDMEYKGRIIGKEGRNIKAFEQVTGVDVILEEDQPSVLISCFDGVRREIARRTLCILIEDGRIHPGRIEEVMAQVTQDLERETTRRGEEAALAVEVSGLHPQLIRLLGKLHYRTSYGQNVLMHTQEVAFLCGAMASDLGLDPRLGRRCGLMHDIGKALDHEQEGSHPVLGYEVLKRWGESEIVANAALAHHEGHEVISAYTTLAAAADAISAARPGARHHSLENHLKRLAQVEEIALGFTGVQRAYAIQGGRELRVIVDAAKMPDDQLPKTARDIARRIEDEVRFPGEIKVTLIRENRGIAVAR